MMGGAVIVLVNMQYDGGGHHLLEAKCNMMGGVQSYEGGVVSKCP